MKWPIIHAESIARDMHSQAIIYNIYNQDNDVNISAQ